MELPIKIRYAIKADLPKLYQIEIQAFSHPYDEKFFYNLWDKAPVIFILAESNEEVLGYIIGFKGDSKKSHVISIAVSPKYQGKGIGKLLMTQLLKEITSKEVWLEVAVGNLKARKFYESIGFIFYENLPKYYQNNEDAIRMRLFRKEHSLN